MCYEDMELSKHTYRLTIDNSECVFKLDTHYTKQKKVVVIVDGTQKLDSRPMRTCLDRIWRFLRDDVTFNDCDVIFLDDDKGISQVLGSERAEHLVIKPLYRGEQREMLLWSAINSVLGSSSQ